MSGKILKIAGNDLYGNVDERQVVVFASFKHVRYMNQYVIFTFMDEYDKNKLYYGSVHVKEKSLVVFSVREEVFKYINEFVQGYLNRFVNSSEYEINNISNMEKIELISYNEMECDKLLLLDELSIPKNADVLVENRDSARKPIFLYIVLIGLILLLGGLTYLYLFPDKFLVEYKMLTCDIKANNGKLDMTYNKNMLVKFDDKSKVDSIKVTDSYVFSSMDIYLDFKDNNRQDEFFKIDGVYKYDDEELELRIIYSDDLIIDEYDSVLLYLKKEGYECVEGKYYE